MKKTPHSPKPRQTKKPSHLLVLASASPRRQAFLKNLGLQFNCLPTPVDETPLPQEGPKGHCKRLAAAKARWAVKNYQCQKAFWVIAADTIVYLPSETDPGQEEPLGKPPDSRAARETLERLSGQYHTVLTALCLQKGPRLDENFRDLQVVASRVRMRRLQDAEIKAYIKTREWCDKAGGYAIQGLGASLVEEVHGSYSNVIGLPLETLIMSLKKWQVPGTENLK